MDDLDFEFLLRVKRRKSGEYLSEDEVKILGVINSGRTVDEASRELGITVEKLDKIISKLNQDAPYVERIDNDLSLTSEGKEFLQNVNRLRELLVFYAIHPYVRSAVTVDGIIFYKGNLVLIERKNEPYKGKIALPGGYVTYGEKVEDALIREMKEEIGREIRDQTLFTVVSDPARDPRGHTISIVYSGRIDEEPEAGDDASKVFLVGREEIGKLQMAFDHQEIIKDFILRRAWL
ncbi:MAG: NUDIX hydrolase [Candidatus Thermoplasmatota archaeon]|jgi:8-oxo-dGTP diphosphatase|nr:NUDIX hydrolase [Candidatus Thermoplasmatota archaeon]